MLYIMTTIEAKIIIIIVNLSIFNLVIGNVLEKLKK